MPGIPEDGIAPKNLEDATWTNIQKLVAADIFKNYYKIGATKTITLTTGEQVVMKVASINDGSGLAGTYYPKGTVDFISVDCLKTAYQINSTATNAGGWFSCDLRKTLNNSILATLPTDLKNSIIEKTHYRSIGSQSTELRSSSDKLWLPTNYEVNGEIKSAAANTENENYNNHYLIFANDSARIKHLGTDGSACHWWLSSSGMGDNNVFNIVSSAGSAYTNTAVTGNYGVPICFRIG